MGVKDYQNRWSGAISPTGHTFSRIEMEVDPHGMVFLATGMGFDPSGMGLLRL